MLNVVVPIGFVRNGIKTSRDFSDVISEIVVLDEFKEGLYRLDESKEIIVLFIFDKNIEKGFKHILHPKGDDSMPEVGVFASRSPFRPNPIGVTRVELISIKGNVLTVKGLDAFDGTPVIDIKPAERRDGGR
jgi:tRNA (adenine37-N6)-methyltransferase